MAQARKLLQHVEDQKATWGKDVKDETQGSAWTNSAGNDPGGPGDAFTWRQAEASAASQFNGIYYNAGKKVRVTAGCLLCGCRPSCRQQMLEWIMSCHRQSASSLTVSNLGVPQQ